MSDLSIEKTRSGDKLAVVLKGRMTETSRYAEIDVAGVKSLEINMDGVSVINSKGIQIWREFMKNLPAGLAISYVKCPLKVVNQLNLFPTFNGGKSVEIVSFYAPYFCEKCDQTASRLLESGKHFTAGKPIAAPAMTCEKCKAALEFDGVEQKYFLFLRRS